ncbi:MAG: asparagine synthase (glutamine-hydrolyzing) [Minicystis sp.]
MCGIFGYLSADRDLDEARTLETAQKALWHRGPDDRGTFRTTFGPLRVGLAHTRLSIIDLSAGGHQPTSTADGRYTLVYNGEVYNFRELREELTGLGDTFHSSCDTEVVLKAYARWGAGALTRFRGMFAIAVWDAKEGSLFLARDRLGIKPLYYARGPRGFAFASEVRALLATGFAERRLSRRALQSYFAFGAVSGPDVILDGVASLPPGHWLRMQGGEITVREYWRIPLVDDRDAAFDDEVHAIRPILQDAVKLRLVADVPVGIFLSGGIDSSVVVALATRASDAPVHTFTVTFDEERYSEAPFAAEVARRYGCDHHQVHLPASRAVMDFDKAIRALDQPSVDGVNTYFVSKAAREAGLTVALSGLGGDEVFAGYPYFRAFGRLRSLARAAGRLPPRLHRGLGFAEAAAGAPIQMRKLSALLGGDASAAAVYAAQRAMFTPEERRRLLADGIEDPGYLGVTVPADIERHLDAGKLGPVNAYSALELSNYLRHTLLRDTDAMSMAHAVEVRVPLIDHVLLERVMRTPGALKLDAADNKPLLTAAVEALPESAVNRQKMGFTLPYEAWFRGPLRPWMEELLLGDTVRRLGFLRVDGVERLWRAFLKGDRYTNYARIWCVAALAGWCEANGVA